MSAPSIPSTAFVNIPCFSPALDQQSDTVSENRSRMFYTDEDIIEGLKTRDIKVIKYVYKQAYPQIRYLVTSNSGSIMDAEDLFQDAMVVLYQKISAGNIMLTSSFKTFLYSICRHLWLQKLTKHQFNSEYRELADLDDVQDEENNEEHILENEKYSLFQRHFLKMNANDQKVLKLYLEKTSLKEMARIMGYKSENYAKFRKYICKEKLKNAIINDPQSNRIFQGACLSLAFNG